MTLLFLHGLGQNKDSWNQTIRCIANKNAECPDLLSIEAEKQSFSSLMESLEARYANCDGLLILCGLSLGAILAMEFYMRHPERVKSMVLIAPQYKMPTLLLDIQNLVFRFMPKKAFRKIGIRKENMISISKSMRNLDYRDRIPSIKCPVTIVCGSKDKVNKKAAMVMNQLLPNSNVVIVPGAGHEVNLDAPERLAEIIRKAAGI